MNSFKKEFIDIICKDIHRDGISDLMDYLEESGFYTCPASTKYHGSYEGGLVEHSLNVYYSLKDMLKYIYASSDIPYSNETIAIVSLFHDLCKIGKYKKGIKNIKNKDTGIWEQIECFEYNNEHQPEGHGSGSVYIIMNYIQLKKEERQAIHWHMGSFDLSQYNTVGDMGNTYERNTLAFALHIADMIATYVCENKNLK